MKCDECMDCLTSFEAEYKEDCPSCGDDSDVIEVSAHTDKLSVEKLQEQLSTAKKALTEIASPNVIGAARIPLYRKIASEALAAIGKGENNEI